MPRGRPRKIAKVEIAEETAKSVQEVEPINANVESIKSPEAKAMDVAVAMSHKKQESVSMDEIKKQTIPPLQTGEAYFEVPETGEVIVGSEKADHIWYRKGNGGKGMWINKKR